jgi:hypothetical protein
MALLPSGWPPLLLSCVELVPENRAIFVGSLDSAEKTLVMQSESKAIYVSPGYLLFHRDGVLQAQPFDAKPNGIH